MKRAIHGRRNPKNTIRMQALTPAMLAAAEREEPKKERSCRDCEALPVPSLLAGTNWIRVLLAKNHGDYGW